MKYSNLALSFLFLVLIATPLQAQLIVTAGGTANAIANTIVGAGMTVSNATLNCSAGAYGTYTTGALATNLGAGMNSGIVLTTGDAIDVVGPNINSGSTGAWFTTFNDPNLVALQPGAVNDVCKLEFDLVPKCSTLNIKYVFGSDEYPEFVTSNFNDAFGFFLSGPNPLGGNYTNVNIATLPTTGQYVSIDNVNATTNSAFYVNNAGGSTIEYDGFTVPLTASANVISCQTYHMKIIIADAGDWSYDSGVFFNSQGLSCPASQVFAATVATTPVTCAALGTATATVTSGVGPFTYVWSNGQTTSSISNLAAGNYTVTINDAEACTPAIVQTVTVANNTSINGNITAQTNVNCFGGNNGSVTVAATLGAAPFQYNINGGAFGSSTTFSNLSAGTYTVQIKDNLGCTFNIPVTITQPTQTTAVINNPTNVNCNGSTNGSATVTPSGGSGVYTYSWSNGQTTATATNLAAGVYTAYVINSNNATCSASTTVNITQPTPITATINTSTNVNCNGSANGSATVMPAGGSGVYTYSWSNGQTSATATNLAAGTYTAYVINASAATCSASTTVTITQPSAITATISSSTNVNCNGASNGAATVLAGGGTGLYTYSWSNGQTTSSISNLAAGTYTAYVINANVSTCSASVPVTITQPSAITSTIGNSSNATCFGSANGTATVVGNGGTGLYTYSWSNGQTVANATSLAAGTYTAYVMNANVSTCSASVPVTISQPTQTTAVINNPTNVNCNGSANGSATVTPAGGSGVYTYSWSNGQTTATATNLAAGVYTAYVINSNNVTCSASTTVNITEPAPITANINSSTNVNCNGSANGSATVTPAGGSGAYTYSWSNGQTSATATNLAAGTYTAYVINASVATCSASTTVTITQPSAITATISSSTNVDCNGVSNGDATVLAGGGTGLYTYSWSNGQTTSSISNLAAGTYTAYVINANVSTCSASVPVTITQPSAITATIGSSSNATCFGSANGTATVVGNGGTGLYTYSWSNGQTAANATNLAAGTYTAYVINANVSTCSASVPVTISQPTQTTAVVNNPTNVNCNGSTNGSATVTPSGGSGVYTYSWSNGQTTATATNLAAGTYTVYVINTNNTTCSASTTVNITEPAPITANINSSTNVNCNGSSNGSATVTPAGGSGVYTYSWSNGQTAATATNLAVGTYTAYVINASVATCSASTTVTISEPSPITASISTFTDANCNGVSNGAATVLAGGGSGFYTYSWSPSAQTNAQATNLGAGTYTAYVMDANASTCSASVPVTISEPTPMSAQITSTSNVTCFGASNGTVSVVSGGGSGAYNYSWTTTPPQNTQTATGLGAGTYTVYVMDANAATCSASTNVTVTQLSALTANINNIINVDCNGSANGAATVLAGGSSGLYAYSWLTSPVQTTATATGLSAGTYTVFVIDPNANNCLTSTTVNISQPNPIVANIANFNNINCNGAANGTALVAGNGGSGAYTYSWSNGQTTANATNLGVGTYTAYVMDANAATCSASTTASISEPTPLNVTINNAVNANCNGTANGSATALAGGGSGNYAYSWSPSAQSAAQATNLGAGTYTVYVSEANAATCSVSTTITITEPTQLVASTSLIADANCFGSANGSANVSATGGFGAYTYSWITTPVQTTAIATNLGAATYTVFVIDSNAPNCSTSTNISIAQPTALTANINNTINANCFNTANGSATVLAGGSSGTYNYSWATTPAQTTATATGLAAGAYTVYVNDANVATCSASTLVNITEPAALSLTTSHTNVTCNGAATATANVTPTGGSGAYGYSWTSLPAQTTQQATNLGAGNYTIYVNDANAATCSVSASLNITQPTALAINLVNIDSTTCFGGSNGLISVSGSGGNVLGVYNYSWNTTPSQSTSTATGLSAGTYTVYLSDIVDASCRASASYTVAQPTQITASTTVLANVNCYGGNNGSATVTGFGGSGSYTYSWLTPPTQLTQIATNLPANTFMVYVIDANDPSCKANQLVTISQPTAIVVTPVTTTNVNCNSGTNGNASVNVTGGSGSYLYSWNTTPVQTTAAATNLAAGNYTLYVTDANASNCMLAHFVTITQPTTLTAAASAVTNVNCFGANNGTTTVLANGSSGTYNYSWVTTPAQLSQNANNLVAGTYTVWVSDVSNANCKTSASVTVTQPAVLAATASVTANVSCNSGSNGAASVVTTNGGSGTYTYSWNTTPPQLTSNATNLLAGAYTVYIADANATTCSISKNVTVTQPTPLNVSANVIQNVKCFGQSNGSAHATPSGGSGSYSYSWITTPVQSTQNATNLIAGTYTVWVIDNNDINCKTFTTITITEPTLIVPTLAAQINVACNGGNNGSATVNVSGGSGTYTYTWNTNPAQYAATANNLAAGNYIVTVNDGQCAKTLTTQITQPTPMTIATQFTNPLCNGDANGTINAIATNGTASYQYSWNTTPPQLNANAMGLPVGTYTVFVTDANGCMKSKNVTLTQPTALAGTPSQVNVKCFGASTGSAKLQLTGGVTPYTYLWNSTPAQTTATAAQLPAGNYSVTATDKNGCQFTQSYTLTQPLAPLSLTISHTDVICFGGDNGTVNVTATGGTPVYTYTWNTNPKNYTPSVDSLKAGNYIVTVVDSNNCKAQISDIIIQPTKVKVIVSNEIDAYCNLANGNATVVASGGTGSTYTYSWHTTPSVSNPTLAMAFGGTYMVTAKDSMGCEAVLPVEIKNVPPPVAAFTSDPLNTDPIFLHQATIHFINQSTGAIIDYGWDFGDGNNSTVKNPVHTYIDTDIYTAQLIVYDPHRACPDTFALNYEIIPNGTIFVPTAFSPNGDGTNDNFFVGGEGIKSLQCIIFDRWGKIIVTLNSQQDTWNGLDMNGKSVPEGVYIYKIDAVLNDGHLLNRGGSITIVR